MNNIYLTGVNNHADSSPRSVQVLYVEEIAGFGGSAKQVGWKARLKSQPCPPKYIKVAQNPKYIKVAQNPKYIKVAEVQDAFRPCEKNNYRPSI